MGINFDKAMGVHAEALRLRAERTQILASNLANASTPGYKARDIDFAAALSSARSEGEAGVRLHAGSQVLYRQPHQSSADGNTVELGVEQALFSQNASDFQTSLTFLNMQLRGLASAIRGE